MRVLIVEDEVFIAIEIEGLVEECGHEVAGIAGDSPSALALAPRADVALVDLNLRDGPTGRTLGEKLSEDHGLTVVYMTANPSQLAGGTPSALGVLPKPASDGELRQLIDFVVSHHADDLSVPPPSRFSPFARAD